ncbi:UDP-glucose 4-epimerase GalE [Thermovibrio sp.]
MKVLITGGAGYIGSHISLLLAEKGHEVLVVDDLSNGHREAVLKGKFVKANVGDKEKVREILDSFKPDAVMHFAAFIEVGESVKNPLSFYGNNFSNTLNLLEALIEKGVKNFIFSSTAAVYGNPVKVPIPEEHPKEPINPYGKSKLFVEKALEDFNRAYGLNYISLRYFNAAGADPKGRIGESHNPETHLIPLILKTAKGERESIKIFGTDYPTPDGTCIRDFIHVNDLAQAHLDALVYLLETGKSGAFNCGYGRGFSVKEVIERCKRITGVDFKVEKAPRREGDPAVLVADPTKLKGAVNWEPKYDDLDFIIKTAWNWELNRRF